MENPAQNDLLDTTPFQEPAKSGERPKRVTTPLIRRITTCVPTQLHEEKDKLDWLERTIDEQKPHIFVTSQEFFGGITMMPQHPFYREEELLPKLLDLTSRKKIGMVCGVVENDNGSNRERLWFLDEGKLIGKITKFALPRYSRKGSKGSYEAVEEMSMKNRFVKFPIQGLEVAGMFCWEVFSTSLWNGLRQVEPDMIVSPIKFGINSYPSYEERDGKIWAKVGKFNYMQFKDYKTDPWYERLRMAANYDTLCPIFVSTNSWGCRGRSHPLCGVIWDTDNLTNIWTPENEVKEIPEKVITTEYDFNRVRGLRGGKWDFYELVDENPPGRFLELTMLYKIRNIERKRLKGDSAMKLAEFESETIEELTT